MMIPWDHLAYMRAKESTVDKTCAGYVHAMAGLLEFCLSCRVNEISAHERSFLCPFLDFFRGSGTGSLGVSCPCLFSVVLSSLFLD